MINQSTREKVRRRALKLAKALDYYCPICDHREGSPCESTGRSKTPGQIRKVPHKYRLDRARAYLQLHNWQVKGTDDHR